MNLAAVEEAAPAAGNMKGVNMPKKTITGCCKFCGQSRIIDWNPDEPISQAEADELATKDCDCQDARVMQNREKKIQRAKEWIANRFAGNPIVIQLFNEAVKAVVNNEVENVSIKFGEWSHKIFLDGDGYLIIKSGKKIDEEAEFA